MNSKGQVEILIFVVGTILFFAGILWFLSSVDKTKNKMDCPQFKNYRITDVPLRCAEYFNLTNPNE